MQKFLGLIALLASSSSFAMGCEFVTDAANDVDDLGIAGGDLTAVYMDTAGNDLTVTFELSTPAQAAEGWRYKVYMTYADGQRWMAEIDYTLTSSGAGGGFPTGYVAPWDDDGTDYDNSTEYDTTMSGNSLAITFPLAAAGNPSGEITGFATAIAGVQRTDQAEGGSYTVGDSCAKRGAEANLTSDGRYLNTAAGSLGWLVLAGGLAGLRRRRS